MVHETTTSLGGAEVIERAKEFFLERVPQYGAYLEASGELYAAFRGQGGEELTIAVVGEEDGRTKVRGSSLLYDQAIGRFFSTLPKIEAKVAE